MSNDHIRLDRSKWEPCDKCKICLRRRAHDSSNYKKEYDLERLEVILNQRMTMREEVSQRFSVTAKIPVDRLREIVAAERERSAVLERLGEFGRLFIDYVGCPRGAMGRMEAPLTEELLSMPVITDVDGGRWRPVNEDALQEAIALLKERQG